MNTNPYEFQFVEIEDPEVRKLYTISIDRMNAAVLMYYRLFFVCLCSSAYIAFFVFDSLFTARVLAVVAGLMAAFDISLVLILSALYQDEKQ